METQSSEQVFHDIQPTSSGFSIKVLLIFIVILLLGVGSGYAAAHMKKTVVSSGTTANSSGTTGVLVGATYGSGDTATFKDTAEGVMDKGGIGPDGQYHLVRPGGASQFVYLTSSLVDLSQFIGHKVKVWGQTQKGQEAGWLMDVGKVEVEQ